MLKMNSIIRSILSESISVKEKISRDPNLIDLVGKISETLIIAFKANQKVLFCGNGGSASDAQHLAAELSGRFMIDRPALFAEALHVNSSALTAIGNDFSFAEVYSRQVQAKGAPGDILVALSTSGNSENILRAATEARKKGMIVVGFTGMNGGKLKSLCDYCLLVPSHNTARIQEAHITLGHIICQIIESTLFPANGS
ncbi:MAG: D-sedoheptulose 7-phosphate isomerase [Saprospiraceae bacterium]|nr:D-sedoheptulose 7-phosphate isomerase [Saprospiraceae bacterium]